MEAIIIDGMAKCVDGRAFIMLTRRPTRRIAFYA